MRSILIEHNQRYPHWTVQDPYQLVHQAALGSEHALRDEVRVRAWLMQELDQLGPGHLVPAHRYRPDGGRPVRLGEELDATLEVLDGGVGDLVVGPKLGAGEFGPCTLALAVLALLSITVGTLYQKRHVRVCDVRTPSCVQLLAALLETAPVALLEAVAMDWQPALVGSMAWSVLGLTLGGASLLYLLIQRGATTSVTALLYLVPPCTAVMAWLLFAEPLTPAVLLGFAVTAAGVALVVRAPATA